MMDADYSLTYTTGAFRLLCLGLENWLGRRRTVPTKAETRYMRVHYRKAGEGETL